MLGFKRGVLVVLSLMLLALLGLVSKQICDIKLGSKWANFGLIVAWIWVALIVTICATRADHALIAGIVNGDVQAVDADYSFKK